jgi:FlaA1/EpsC-like NDP-sugar epimerase
MSKRLYIIAFVKTLIISSAFLLAFLLRFEFMMSDKEWTLFFQLLPAIIIIKIAVFWKMGLGRGWWRYVSLVDVFDIFRANILASLCFVIYAAFICGMHDISRSVLILDLVLCFLMSCGVRFVTRIFREQFIPLFFSSDSDFKRILVIGAGSAGQMIVRETWQNPSLKMSVVGFIDDDPEKKEGRFHGVPVLGTRNDIVSVCRKKKINEVIIAIPSASGKDLRAIVKSCRETCIAFKTLPSVGDFIDGTAVLTQVREVDLNDLLGRTPVRLDMENIISLLQGKKVLITGAAGSIGSELCRQAARFNPAEMVLFDNAETPLFYMEKELKELFPDLRMTAIIGDVRNRPLVNSVFAGIQPEVVFHAAAYKHVPMMEANPAAAVVNNVQGTRIMADAAHVFATESFVMISTDKAVKPTNVMGATKRAAELYVQNLARQSKTRFVTVRFGNVLGSNGSVVPIFKEQIRKGGPVTVTHPEVTRFFMTIPEATQLVIQAGSMGRGAEIFLLDMGEPIKIAQLAEELIRMSGFRPYEDIDINFTGLRPGEKLYEELLLAGEGVQPTSHEKIMVANSTQCNWNALNLMIDRLYQKARDLDMHAVVAMLREIVPEYRSQGKWKQSYQDRGKQELVGNDFMVQNLARKAPKYLNSGLTADNAIQLRQKELGPGV